jgi:TolB-like protein/Flp pilus assembly protein TadD
MIRAPAGGTFGASDEVRFLFEDYVLDTARRELRRGSARLSMEPQVFDLLEYLVRNRDRVVSKDDLLAAVWGGRIVSESTLASRINAARRSIGDTGEQQQLIRTIIGKGIRFVGEAREQHDTDRPGAPPRLPRLSMVVLPFANFSNDPELEHFADGIADDLTTDLPRTYGAFVIARNTAFTFKGKPVDVKKIGHELGVRYVVEGSVRRIGDLLRLNVQLTDAESGAHLWADRFDTDPADLAQAQNEITGRLARSLNLKLLEAAGFRIEGEGPLDADPQDLLIYGRAMFNRATTPAILQEAQRVFERVLEIEPDSIGAKIEIAYALAINVANYWSTSVERDEARAEQLLVQARDLDPNNYRARAALGLLRRLQNRLDESRIELETAIALAPNFAPGFFMLGTTLILLGEPDAAILETNKGLRLNPSGAAVPAAYAMLSQGHLLLGHVEPAIELARKACASNPRLYYTHMLLAAALGLKGELEKASAALAAGIKLRPEFNSLARWRAYMTWGSPKYWALREKTIDLGLRCAGMLEE